MNITTNTMTSREFAMHIVLLVGDVLSHEVLESEHFEF